VTRPATGGELGPTGSTRLREGRGLGLDRSLYVSGLGGIYAISVCQVARLR
jgi:hypothetical protein